MKELNVRKSADATCSPYDGWNVGGDSVIG
jgi:hypothetical protein